VGPGIVEGGPRRGASAVVATVVAGATEVVVLAFPLPLALTLAFATIVGVGGRRGRGRRTRRWFLLGAEAATAAKGALHLRAQSRK
jgi:hypothetical protein